MYLETGSKTFGKCVYVTNSSTDTVSTTVKADLNKGAYIKIPMVDSYVAAPDTAWCKKGQFGYKISRKADILELATSAVYGHSQVTANPTVTIGVSSSHAVTGGISFSFGCIAQSDDTYEHITEM